MNTNIILVNQNDEAIGESSVIDAHLGEAKLHRAYTAILKNNKGEILLTKRSLTKPLWPTYWDGSFSSHPRVDETVEQSCERRVKEELGIDVKGFKNIFSYTYHINWNVVFSEWEINHILVAEYDGKLKPNPNEVSDYQWLALDKAVDFSLDKNNLIAPWWIIAIEKIVNNKVIL